MATILGLALKINADASSVQRSLTPVERALGQLSQQAEKATASFRPLAEASDAAATAQEEFAQRFTTLLQQLEDKVVTPREYAAAFAQLTDEVKASVAAFQDGIRIQQEYGDQTRVAADEVTRLLDLERQGAIDIVALNRAAIDQLGINEQAARSARERADAVAAAERIQAQAVEEARRREADATAEANRVQSRLQSEAAAIRAANLTAQERFDEAIARARDLEQAGVLTKDLFNRELERQANLFAKATIEAGKTGAAVEDAGKQGLKFNELSGVLSVLPGQLGSVAARFSAISSAGEGLNRVFGAGISTGLRSVGSQLAGLVTPTNIALGAIAGFGTAAVGVVRGLTQLEGRLESLGNTALRIGTDFQTIQVLDEAARRTGQSVEAVAAGLQKFNINLDAARRGSGDAAEAFDKLGISQDRLQTADTAGLAQEVAAALQRIEDPAKRAALAMDVLGKSGLSLLPVFAAIEDSRLSLERFAAGISTVDQGRVADLGDAFDNVGTALAGLGQAAILPFAGVVEGFANLLADLIASVTRLAQAIGTVLTPVLDAVGETFSAVGDGLFAVTRLFDGWLGNTENATAQVSKLREQVEEPLNQGFAGDFQKTLQSIEDSVGKAIDDSAKFGEAGFNAALRYQEAVDELRQDLDRGLFNEETFRRQAEQAGVAFREELARIEQDAQLDIQIKADAEKTLAGLQERISKAIEGAQQFGAAGFDAAERFQSKLRDLGSQFEDGRINAATLANEVERATSEYDKQINGLKQIEELQKRTLEAEKARVAEILKQGDATTQLERDISTLQEEQIRLQDQIRRARESQQPVLATALGAQLAAVDQSLTKLEDQQQAVEQGFSEGFTRAFQETDKGINELIVKAEEFGSVGAFAAQALQAGIAQAQAQARDGILTQETYEREVAQQRDIFQQRLDAANRVEEFLRNGVDARQQAELKATEELEKRKKEAATNVQAIEAKLIEERKKLEEAREAGDLRGARAGATRVRELERVQRQEQQLADGRLRQQNQIGQQFLTGLNSAQQFQNLVTQQNDNFLKSFNDTYAGANQALAANAAAAAEQAAKLERLLTPTNQLANTADIRTAEGQQLLLDVASQGIDPALVESRLQTKQLNLIAQGISQAASNYFNSPVAIVGGAALG
jgi:hypothetical protein